MLDAAALPADDVRHFMTADPVTVNEGADVRTIARLMTEALVHWVVVTDAEGRPIGVLSATDLIAALVYAREQKPVGQCDAAR